MRGSGSQSTSPCLNLSSCGALKTSYRVPTCPFCILDMTRGISPTKLMPNGKEAHPFKGHVLETEADWTAHKGRHPQKSSSATHCSG